MGYITWNGVRSTKGLTGQFPRLGDEIQRKGRDGFTLGLYPVLPEDLDHRREGILQQPHQDVWLQEEICENSSMHVFVLQDTLLQPWVNRT